MDELTKGLSISLPASQTAPILVAFKEILKSWGLVMPPVEPLVLDFGLGDFYRIGLVEYWVSNEVEAGYCGKFLFVFDGQTCPMHLHHGKHETFFIVKGQVEMKYAGSTRLMAPGEVLRVDTYQPHSFTGVGPALLLEVSQPCQVDDNYFDNRKIPIGGNFRTISEETK
jgi:D-lyxose ketol-isomerase